MIGSLLGAASRVAIGTAFLAAIASAEDAAPQKGSAASGEATLAAQLQLLEMLRGRQFSDLTRRVEAEQARFEADPQREPVTNQMWSTFAIADPALDPVIEAWVAEVHSYVPHTVKGLYHRARAWDERGGNLALETSPEQFAGMSDHAKIARASFARALELHPKLMIAWSSLLDLAKADSGAAARKHLLAEATAVCPSCLAPRRQYLTTLAPRWGGSYQEMYAYLARISADIARYPRLSLLSGYPALEHALEARDAGHHDTAVHFLDEALSHGDYWAYRSARCREWSRLGRYEEALADCEFWLAHGTARADALYWKAVALRHLAREEEAAAAIEVARKLDPTNHTLAESDGNLARLTEGVTSFARFVMIAALLAVAALAAFAALALFRRVRGPARAEP
jgi:tetratricopeptide (TPR) repeat protein